MESLDEVCGPVRVGGQMKGRIRGKRGRDKWQGGDTGKAVMTGLPKACPGVRGEKQL